MSKIEQAKTIIASASRPHPLTGEVNPEALSRAMAHAAMILKAVA